MDHLPLPCNPVLVDAVSIPLLVSSWSPTDLGDFESFPSRRGWKFNWVSDQNFTRDGVVPTERDIAAMFQSWLYFGLLSCITEEPFTIRDFARADDAGKSMFTSDGDAILSSKCLGTLVPKWYERIASQPWSKDEAQFRKWYEKLDLYLQIARDTATHATFYSKHRYKRLGLVIMSIAVLSEYLEAALDDLFREGKWEVPVDQSWRGSEEHDCGKPLRDIMLQRGWCTHRISGSETTWMGGLSVSALWFFANLTPPKAREHLTGMGGGLRCTASSCQLMNIKKEQYHIAHQTAQCSCEMVGPKTADLASALLAGSFPIIKLQASTTQEQRAVFCEAEAHTPGTYYVAISHVWSDGHGNPLDNRLPTCFLGKLGELVERLPSARQDSVVRIWLDTLCVPRGELKQLALSRLKEPYELATQVLVLDSYLGTVLSAQIPAAEIVAHIQTSAWSQRLWTFNEGRLSGERLWFQFKDQAINLSQVANKYYDEMQRAGLRSLHRKPSDVVYIDILSRYHSSKIWSAEELDFVGDSIVPVRNELLGRTTSRASDEAICLANILGLEIGPILAALKAERMTAFWSLLHRVPLGMAFSTASQKLAASGHRWAPASFMGDLDTRRWYGPQGTDDTFALATDMGLLADVYSYSIGPVTEPSELSDNGQGSEVWVIDVLKGNGPCSELALRDKEGNWYTCVVGGEWHQDPTSIDAGSHLAILVPWDLRPESIWSDKQYGNLSLTNGIIVSYTESTETGRATTAKAHRHVNLRQLAPGDSKLYERLWETAQQVTDLLTQTGGSPSTSDQQVRSAREKAVHQLSAEPGIVDLQEQVLAAMGVPVDETVVSNHLDWGIYRLTSQTPWLGIEVASATSQWCID